MYAKVSQWHPGLYDEIYQTHFKSVYDETFDIDFFALKSLRFQICLLFYNLDLIRAINKCYIWKITSSYAFSLDINCALYMVNTILEYI